MQNRFADVQAFAAKFGAPNNLVEDERRDWVRRLAETLAARYPAEGWGNKARSAGAAISGDIVATRSPFEAADVLTGSASSPVSTLQWNAVDPATLIGQAWIAVTPHDWLAAETPPPPAEPPAPPVEGESLPAVLARFEARLAAIEAALAPGTSGASVPVLDIALRLPYGLGTATGTATPRR